MQLARMYAREKHARQLYDPMRLESIRGERKGTAKAREGNWARSVDPHAREWIRADSPGGRSEDEND